MRLPSQNFRSKSDQLSLLVAVALLLSWLSYVFEWNSGSSILNTTSLWYIRYDYVSNSASWIFYLRFLAFSLFLSVGFIQCAKNVRWRKVRQAHYAAMITAVVCCLFWLLWSADYFLDSLPRLIYANSPLNLLIVFGFFIGLNPRLWKWIDPALYIIAYGSVAAGWLYAMGLPSYHRHVGGNPMFYHITLAIWPAAFLLLSCHRTAVKRQIVTTVPIVGCMFLAVYNQNRSWSLVCLFLLFLRFMVVNARSSSQKWIRIGFVVIVALFISGRVIYIMDAGTGNEAVDGLIGRLTENTRGGQLQDFFEQIPMHRLITGMGADAGYDMEGKSNYQYIDNQHLFILFKFGFLAWWTYAYTVFAPALRVLQARHGYPMRSLAFLLLLWGMSLGGLSVFQNLRPGPANMLMVMIAGRACYQSAQWQRLQKCKRRLLETVTQTNDRIK